MVLIKWNLPTTEPQETEIFLRFRHVPFHTGIWRLQPRGLIPHRQTQWIRPQPLPSTSLPIHYARTSFLQTPVTFSHLGPKRGGGGVYICVHLSPYVFRQQTGRQNILNRMTPDIPLIYSALNSFVQNRNPSVVNLLKTAVHLNYEHIKNSQFTSHREHSPCLL
jgi:hypothetical protein